MPSITGYGAAKSQDRMWPLCWVAIATAKQIRDFALGNGCATIELSEWRFLDGHPILGTELCNCLVATKQFVADVGEPLVTHPDLGEMPLSEFAKLKF